MRTVTADHIKPELLQVGHVHYPIKAERRVEEYHAEEKHNRERELAIKKQRKQLREEQEYGYRASKHEINMNLLEQEYKEAMSEFNEGTGGG